MELTTQVLSGLAGVAVMFVTNRQNKWWGSNKVISIHGGTCRGEPGSRAFVRRGNSHAHDAVAPQSDARTGVSAPRVGLC
jgi:hypothetical protein